jgi:cystathionine beta-lyase/cystathionine gamma-synthase
LIALLDEFKPEVLYFETVSNPMLIVADVKMLIDAAKKRGIVVIVDNTFASPYLVQPLKLGADLVIHSATKYLAGHGNIMAGVVCGNNHALMQAAIEYRKLVGHQISPDDAYRLGSQLKTFNLRFGKQCENARKLAGFLNKSSKINKVFFPGLGEHETHELAKRIFTNNVYGAMVTFQLAGDTDSIKRRNCDLFIKEISEYFHLIPTLGDLETIFLPVETVWADKYPYPGTIRLSVGIEEYDYLESVFSGVLDRLK